MANSNKSKGDRAEVRNAQQRAQRARNRAAIRGDEVWHGTSSGYTNHCCRCESCRSAYRSYVNEWRLRPSVAERRRIQGRENERKPENQLRRRAYNYGLTREQLTGLLAVPGCEACGRDVPLSVDHDHRCCSGNRSCGSCVRGALCRECNQALGLVDDDVKRLEALAAYLRRTGA